MTDPLTIIGDAFQKLKQSVTTTDAHVFDSTTLKDVLEVAEEIQRTQMQRHALHNLKRIKPLLDFFKKYSTPMGILANGTPYLPWVWVSYRTTSLKIY